MKTIDKILNGLKQALAHARGELPDKTFRITHYSVETGDATSPRQPQMDDE